MTTVTSSGSLLFLRPSVVSSTSDRRHLRHLRHQALPELSSLSLLSPKPKAKPFSVKPFLIRSSLKPPISRNSPPNPPPKSPLVSNSTKTLAALFALSLSLSSKISQIVTNSLIHFKARFLTPTPQELQTLQFLQENVLPTAGPLFFAAIKDRPTGYLNTPLTVVASGMAKWLDIYSGVLMVRVLLSWFPNIPWDRQPLSAIRDLCDPYLNLFRNIIPPIFDTLDVSPLLAFAVLGTLGSILNSAKGGY